MNPIVTPQPPPLQGGFPIADMVIEDMIDRKIFGIKKYGVCLQSDNGRNNLIDLYQELLDAVIYLRCEIETN